jgi:hypothetical protein
MAGMVDAKLANEHANTCAVLGDRGFEDMGDARRRIFAVHGENNFVVLHGQYAKLSLRKSLHGIP